MTDDDDAKLKIYISNDGCETIRKALESSEYQRYFQIIREAESAPTADVQLQMYQLGMLAALERMSTADERFFFGGTVRQDMPIYVRITPVIAVSDANPMPRKKKAQWKQKFPTWGKPTTKG